MGFLRFALAFFVAAQHLGGFRYLGSASVYVFFLISGYLMTRVMAEIYGFSFLGVTRFWINRSLRLLPAYFVVLAMSILLLLHVGELFARDYVKMIGMPQTIEGWVQNLTMLYVHIMPNEVTPMIVPQTWALTVELVCYFLISLGITRWPWRAQVWLMIGVVYYVGVLLFSDRPTNWGYFSIPAAFIPFSMGAIIYHQLGAGQGIFLQFYEAVIRRMQISLRFGFSKECGIILTCLFVIGLLVIARYLAARVFDLPRLGMLIFLLNLLVGSLALMAALKWRIRSPLLRKLDRTLGDMAYSIYLGHFFVGIGVAWVWLNCTDVQLWRGPALLALTTLPMLIFSYAIVSLVENPVQSLRERVRPKANSRRKPSNEAI